MHNHGGSPGKRLGVKKFSGWFVIVLSQQLLIDFHYRRSVRYPWKHHRQTTRLTIPSRTTCMSFVHPIHTSSHCLLDRLKWVAIIQYMPQYRASFAFIRKSGCVAKDDL